MKPLYLTKEQIMNNIIFLKRVHLTGEESLALVSLLATLNESLVEKPKESEVDINGK